MKTTILLLALLAAEPPSSGSDIALLGIVAARDPQRSAALLSSDGRSRVVTVGDTAFGGRLLGVSRDGALLDIGGRQVTLRLATNGRSAPPARPQQVVEETAPSSDPAPPLRHRMMRDDLDRRLGVEMNRILAETALKPVLEDGQVVGVAITRLARESVLTDVGLQAGDVITEINGTEIDGLATLMGLYARLQNEKDLRAVVLRGGKPLAIQLTLQ